MRIRAAFFVSILPFILSAGLFLGVFGATVTVSEPAEARWLCGNNFGECNGATAPTLVKACEAHALEHSKTLGRISKYDSGTLYACVYAESGFNLTSPRCGAGEFINLARASGCQKWEEPDGFGGCPNCARGTQISQGDGVAGGPLGGDGWTSTGNPITLGNGNKFFAVTDYRSSGSDTLEFTRYYNSLNWVRTTGFGYGWRHNFNIGLHLESTTGIWAHRPDGRIERFISTDGNIWFAQKGGVVGKLEKTATGWTYTRPDDTVETYNASGGLLSIAKKNGYTQSLAYGPTDWVITDSHGRVLTLEHTNYGVNGWRLTRMIDPEGRIYRFQYQGLNSYETGPVVLSRVVYPDDDDLPLGVSDTPLGLNDVLYTHLDGPDGATTAIDESAGAHQLSFFGGAQIDTAQSRLGGASALFGDASSSYGSSPDSPDWDFGAGAFTVEGWIRFATTSTYSILAKQGPENQRAWGFDWSSSDYIRFYYSTTGIGVVSLTAPWTPTAGAWHHLAVDRDSSNRLRVYIDGRILIDTVVEATLHDSTGPLRIGEYHNGWIDELRVTKGEARYGEAWTSLANNLSVTYLYEDDLFPYGLTGVIDETGERVATWSYNGEGRGLSSALGGGVGAVSLAYNTDGTRTVTNALGKEFKYSFATVAGLPRVSRLDRLASASTPARVMDFAYDTNGFVNEVTDWNGNITKYVHDARGLQTSRTEAFGTAEERTTTTIWDTAWRVPTQITAPERRTNFTYYTDGLLHTRTVTDTTAHSVPYSTNGQSRTWTYTYNAQGLVETVDGPRADVTDLTTYAYDPATGDLASVTNAAGHVTSITSYNADGQPLTTLDANGVETTLTYDARRRLATRIVDSGGTPATTEFAYDDAGQMTGMTLPDNSTLAYEYDPADRLTAISNDLGERIEYTYDSMGNRTGQTVKDASLTILRTSTAIFDDLGRLLKSLGAYAGEETVYGYDANGNTVSVTDPLSNLTQSAFDPLNRVITVTDPAVGGVSGVSGYGYDLAGNRESATDQRGLTTSYVHNGFGEVIQQSSPDTGVTIFTFDAAGNRKTRTDARGVVTEWTYDALGRIATMTFPASPAENVTYAYDNATAGHHGIGRLASVADDSGSTSSRYDARGNVTRDTRVIQTQTYVTEYAYDIADRLASMTYPSGRIVDYARDAIGRVTAVTTRETELATPVTLATGGTYQPFGPLDGLVHGNGLTRTNTYDLDGRMAAIDVFNGLTPVLDLDYTFDLSGDITKITDAGGGLRGRNYDYDPLHRLIDTEELLGDGTTVARGTSFRYDAVGNRTRRSVSVAGVSETENYVNDSLSNQFKSSSIKAGFLTLQSRALSHGDSGNRESDTASGIALNLNYAMTYDATDRLASVSDGATVLGEYLHNAMGQRVSKTRSTGAVRHYIYDLSGRLIAEAGGATGAMVAEYIALEGINLAYITTTDIYWVHADHLGTPQMLTDAAGAEAWSGLYAPFGMLLEETGTLDFNLRFPGQYHDAETEYYYNHFRTYDPTSGRYLESDPIGLRGGWNTYGYVGASPTKWSDPAGLARLPLLAIERYLVIYDKNDNVWNRPFNEIINFKDGWEMTGEELYPGSCKLMDIFDGYMTHYSDIVPPLYGAVFTELGGPSEIEISGANLAIMAFGYYISYVYEAQAKVQKINYGCDTANISQVSPCLFFDIKLEEKGFVGPNDDLWK